MSRAQNGCRGGGLGTKEPLLIDAVIGKVVKRNRRNLSAAWIDYKKAFDSVPHTWLKRVLELYKVDCTVRDFLGQCMGQWSTIVCHLGHRMTAADNHIRIRRGIFQGEWLSPIWFCLSLNPLSTLLEGSGRGFQLRKGGTKVTHLFYMDGLKLFQSLSYYGIAKHHLHTQVDSDQTERSGQESPHYNDVPQNASSEIVGNEAVLAAEAWWTQLF
ncbi:unnamed protein product [Parnassius mnemosyne]|uniref:Reverse transcriptase domain-containing protein n=1 Tax=Parnassius mnemosyne TaxID=213953 RepID=A0AAV1LXV6_9NEOP